MSRGFIKILKDYQEKQRREAMENLIVGSVFLAGLIVLLGVITTRRKWSGESLVSLFVLPSQKLHVL